MPEIALLIPVYNDQAGLNQTLESLLKETKEKVDVVVVDDGSKEPINVPENIGIHHIIFIKSEVNKGIEHVLNLGLKYICDNGYTFVARIDAGDTIEPNRFYKQKQYMLGNPNYMLIGSNVRHTDMDGKEVFIERVPLSTEEIKKKMHINSCFPHPSVMFRTVIIKDIGVYHTDFPAAEDYEFFFRIMNKYEVSNLDEVLICKEINPNSISLSRRKRQLYSRIKIQKKYFNPLVLESYVGLVKSFILLIAPNKLIIGIKSLLSRSSN
ncbi:glycosyl transferase family 2 [Bacillus thuringiensis]|uniref:glycosyltransferase n=1 Tax=Bacillus thuringiensis TaxID=1428 RepID=UPI000D02CF18|nr:glycosyltransferase [Bacillus thuringiensis]MED3578757.1 glycosyltransferase [Bacillus thuringiensis]PRT10363.1 glycosyl transferase family 2 [Bacillus thuringiensis]PRT28996.1 glycosyl transferase family 2 [Bacillus thuringiensis]HDR4870485.1 glycosyltransferase [Bacillus cereus]